jgi:hypothetical protein
LEVLPLLSGTFDLFPLAEVLGLVERAAASGALVVRGREVDGTLYFAAGEFSAGEAADFSGPVDDLSALEIRILEVCVLLLRSGPADFEFRPDVTPPWPAALATPVGPMLERAAAIAREWPSIMSAVESFESQLERTGEITTASVTLSSIGFRLFELIDGRTTIRDLARRAQASLIIVAPEVRSLILAGAVRVLVDPERALATARADVIGDYGQEIGSVLELTELAPTSMTVGSTAPEPPPTAIPEERPTVSVSAPSVETMQPASDPAEFARERAELASRAGLTDPGPVPQAAPVPETAPTAEDTVAAPERAQIVVDRSDLLRMFSGLKED